MERFFDIIIDVDIVTMHSPIYQSNIGWVPLERHILPYTTQII